MSDANPKVSVVMPSLNVASYIKQCIESVINQSLKDIEIICIDAGSTDGTMEILKEYERSDSRVMLLTSEKKSYGYQMNRAISKASGEYIGIVETDDYIESDMYESLYALSRNAEADIVKGSFYHVFEDSPMSKDEGKKAMIDEKSPFTIDEFPAIIKGHPSIWAGIYRREFLLKNDIAFIEEPGGGWVDNPFFYETSFRADSIVYTDEAYYYYREFNPASSSNNLDDYTLPIRRMLDNLDVYEKYSSKSDDIKKMVYMRAFAYLRNIQRREHFEDNLDQLRPYLYEMMSRLDENYVRSHYSLATRLEYYRYLSPLRMSNSFGSVEYEKVLKENDFLYESILKLQNQNKKLNNEAKKTDKTDTSIKSRLKKIF